MMARYIWKNGNIKKIMKLGTLEYNYTINETDYSDTVSGITYICKKLAFGNHVETTWPEPTWTAGENISDGDEWISGSAGLTIYATLNSGDYKCGYGKPSIDGQRFTSSYWASVKSYDMGVYAFKGDYIIDASNKISGVFIVYAKLGGENLAFSDGLFLSDNFFDTAEPAVPFPAEETEYPDGTEDGGYGNGGAVSNGSALPSDTLPTHPLVSGGGINYCWVTDAQLQSFSDALWGRSGQTIFDNLWQKFQNYKFNPMAGIISCHALPYEFHPTVSGTSTSISIAGTSVNVSCGLITGAVVQKTYSVNMNDVLEYQNFLDYTHHTIIAHCPFCGECEIPASACISGSVDITYRVDTLTGNCAAWVCTTDRHGRSHQIACLTGNCAYLVPITGNDNGMSEIIGAIKSSAASMMQFSYGIGGDTSGKMGLSAGVHGSWSPRPTMDIMTARHTTRTVGNLAGSVSLVSNNHLFLEFEFASPSFPTYMTSVRGTPSDIGKTVGNFAGCYVEFSDVHAEGISGATAEEIAEIERMLHGGVYV